MVAALWGLGRDTPTGTCQTSLYSSLPSLPQPANTLARPVLDTGLPGSSVSSAEVLFLRVREPEPVLGVGRDCELVVGLRGVGGNGARSTGQGVSFPPGSP